MAPSAVSTIRINFACRIAVLWHHHYHGQSVTASYHKSLCDSYLHSVVLAEKSEDHQSGLLEIKTVLQFVLVVEMFQTVWLRGVDAASSAHWLQSTVAYHVAVKELSGVLNTQSELHNDCDSCSFSRAPPQQLPTSSLTVCFWTNDRSPSVSPKPLAAGLREKKMNKQKNHFMHKNGALLMRALEHNSYTGWQK